MEYTTYQDLIQLSYVINENKKNFTDFIEKKSGVKCKISVESDILCVSLGESSFYIMEFPFNCSWLIVGRLYSSGDKNKYVDETLKISKLIANMCRYRHIIISLSEDQEKISELLLENKFNQVHTNINFHTGKRVYLYVSPEIV